MSDSTLKPPIPSPGLQLPVPNSNGLPVPSSETQKLGVGSATGNPRNKCALKPGHSLMDWIRLGNSGADLSGTRGRVVPVSSEELARHNKVGDAWMAIRGRVFNVTRYMDFHPGGIDELMRGVGRDATKLFDEVHAWVNYPQLLAKCYIGPLKHVVSVDNDLRKSLLEKTAGDFGKKPPLPMSTTTEIVPRFDWIQKRSEITLYIYTRQFANPGLTIKLKTTKSLLLHIQIAHLWHEFDFELEHEVAWPPKNVAIGAETGKIEVVLTKLDAAPWTNYGTHKATKLVDFALHETHFDYEVISRHAINHDSFELRLCSAQETIVLPPIGYHLAIEAPLNGAFIQRSYTPVHHQYLTHTDSTTSPTLNFIIKSYANGQLSAHLAQIEMGTILQLSAPRGNFSLKVLAAHRNILFLAAGSGLTPFLNLIEPLLRRNTNRLESLRLVYFNKTAQDIWSKEKLTSIEKSDERFTSLHVLSQADDSWSGATGRITQHLISSFLDKSKCDAVSFIAICGPNEFNNSAMDILKELSFKLDNVHVFQG